MPNGNRIKEVRKRKGLTQVQLGKLCGIADSNIRKYESGKQNPKLETLQRIADALEVPLSEIYSDSRNSEYVFPADFHIESLNINPNRTDTILSQYYSRLLFLYESLNREGQKKLLEHAELLNKVPELRKNFSDS